MLKNNQGADLFGDWMIQRKAELRRKGLLSFIQRYTKENAGEDDLRTCILGGFVVGGWFP